LVEGGFIQSKEVKSAFLTTPRHLFLPEVDLKEAYTDGSVITKQIGIVPTSSSTAPSLMASMLEILHLKKGLKVLEIGTGTGYNAAILAKLVDDPENVFSVDIDKDTIKEAGQNLLKIGCGDITLRCVDGADGLPQYAPYDRIIVTASVKTIPQPLVDQLKVGGIIVLPIWFNGTQIAPSLQKQKGGSFIGTSTMIGGYMELRSKSYQKAASKLLVCSENPSLFKESEVISLLKKSYKEKALPFSGILPPRASNFYVFLALHEPKSVEIFLDDNIKGLNFGDSAAGIVDLKNNSACLFTRDNKLLVYGNDGAHQKMLKHLKLWDELKRPFVDRLQLFYYPKSLVSQVKLQNGDIFFRDKSIVVRILRKGVERSESNYNKQVKG
jgi:protein-L-isoaspartate(D-aspartate) O-methyltransferase